MRPRSARALLGEGAAVVAIFAAVAAVGVALGAWTGFPKGTDAYAHMTRLRFVAEYFPRHEWLYGWSAGMPTFETYPELPYIVAAPLAKALGAPVALDALAVMAMACLGIGLYGTVRTATGSPLGGAIAALAGLGSMATWTWIVDGGVYARVLAAGLGACAAWAAARWFGTGGRVPFAATAVLLASAIASHQFVGAVFALGIGLAALAHRGPDRVRRAALLAVATFLLASPAILPAIVRYGGFAGAFLGLERPHLLSPLSVTVDPRHVGVAVIPLVLLGLVAGGISRAVALFVVALALWTAYLFAPNLGIPSHLYYVNGIEPFSVTFLVALVGAFAGGAALGVARTRSGVSRWRRDGAAAVALALVGLNLWLGPTAFLASPTYPKVEDTSARASFEDLALRTFRVDGRDLAHRFLPATASEAVWFSYWYRKPQLRDYYSQGVIHPDWLAWANAAVYTPPFREGRFHAALDWFAVDGFSVFDEPSFTGNLASFAADRSLALVATSEPPAYRQYAVRDASPIWRPTNAPLLVVVGDRDEYDRVARMALERVARPSTLIPIWWQDTADRLPSELGQRAQAIFVEDGRFGDRQAAERALASYADGGARVLLDARGAAPTLSELWPVEAATDEAIDAWRLRGPDDLRVDEFAPPRYGDGPWGAPVGTALRAGGRAVLAQDGRPLVAERATGRGAVVWLGGNLLYHALAYANDVEQGFLAGLLGPVAASVDTRAVDATRLDPERVVVRGGRTRGVFVSESYHPKWTARWSDGSSRAVYYAGPGLMYVAIPSNDGTLTLEFGRGPADYAVWPLVLLGVLICAWPRRRATG